MAISVYNAETNDKPERVITPSAGPAAALYKNPFTFSSDYGLIYPKDLYSSGRAHSVIFDIYEVDPLGLDKALAFGRDAMSGKFTATPDLNEADKASDAAYYDRVGITQQFVDFLGTTGESLRNAVSGGPRTKSSAAASISLYMPETLNFSYEATYNTLTLSSALGSLAPNAVSQAMGSFVDNSALKLAMSAAGYVFNPQQEVMFEGIDFRPFEMNFTFTPSSAQESNTVKEIIKKFRLHAAPKIGGIGSFFFTPPSIFKVSFRYGGAENTHLNLLKKSVLKQVNVNYAPNGWAAFEGSAAPVQTTLSLQFQEIVLVDKTEIEKGF